MNRLLAFGIAAAMVCGCRAPTPTFDPFQGPPRIPPPGTGHVGQAVPSASYDALQPAVSPAAAAPPRYTPREGSYQFRSGSVERHDADRLAENSGTDHQPMLPEQRRDAGVTSVTPSRVSTAGFERDVTAADSESQVRQAANWEEESARQPVRYDAKIRVVEPPIKAVDSAPVEQNREPARFEPAGPVTEISDLPPTRSAPRATIRAASSRSTDSASPQAEETTSDAGPARLASSVRPTAAGSISNRQRYDYDPQYRTLKGRLEFSESENRWKLRYIPIDGQTDRYGGSVVLADTHQLDGFKPGDFVSIEGAIGKKDPRSRGFDPDYQLQRISRSQ